MTTQSPVASSRLTWLLIAAAPIVFANCSSNSDTNGGSGGSTASGGASAGGTPASGGASGGAPANGGAPGNGGASGGMGSGGAPGSGGASGGAASGGAASGGAASGGSANGGSSSGGSTSGGGASGGGGKTSGGAAGASGSTGTGGGSSTGSFTVASTDMKDMDKFDGKFTCNGGSLGAGINPELHWSGAPAGTMSFVITFIDTTLGANSSMGQHWAMYNIPGTVMQLPQGVMKMPTGDLANSKQASPLGGYLAPCAVSVKNNMDDQYEFTVYALNTATLNVTGSNPSVANVLTALGVLPNGTLAASVLGKATFHGHAGVKGQ